MAASISAVAVRFFKTQKEIRSFCIHSFNDDESIQDLVIGIASGANDCGDGFLFHTKPSTNMRYQISKEAKDSNLMLIAGNTPVCTAVGFGNFLTVTISEQTASTDLDKPNILAMMMSQAKCLKKPMKQNDCHAKAVLFNKLLDMVPGGWSESSLNSGKKFLQTLTAVLWKIDPHRTRIRYPAQLEPLRGLNNPLKAKHRVEPLDCLWLVEQHGLLLTYLDTHWMAHSSFELLRDTVLQLTSSLQNLIIGLQQDQERMKDLRAMEESTQEFHLNYLPTANGNEFVNLCETLSEVDMYKPYFLNPDLPTDRKIRHQYLTKLKSVGLYIPVTLYSCTHRGNQENLHLLWKSAVTRDDAEKQAQVVEKLKREIPVYHTRLVKSVFVKTAAKLAIKPMFARILYKLATDDASASINAATDVIDNRLLEYIATGDPDIALDLRSLRRNPHSFEPFFDMAAEVIENSIGTAVDDRRHGSIVHLATTMSGSDLYRMVKDQCSEAVKIPSLEWFRMQFMPRHPRYHSAYTGRLRVRRMIQARQLWQTHPDAHYASAIFRYMKEMAVRYKDFTDFYCQDDKCKIDVGDPGLPIAAVERGKKVLVAENTSFTVADHDFSRSSLTPSVTMKLHIPDSVQESWYDGDVHVGLKCSVFEPSSPARHVLELEKSLTAFTKPIVMLYTDGGPDHRCTYLSVQYPLLYLWHKLDCDMLILGRTPPGWSFKNPAERIMSQLNLALQSVGIMRENAGDWESKIAKCNSMKELRAASERHGEGFKKAFADSLTPTKDLLIKLFGHLKWKAKDFDADAITSSDDEKSGMFEHLSQYFDSSIREGDTMSDMKKRPDLSAFYAEHVRARHYFFCVRKCGKSGCRVCFDRRLPAIDLSFLPDPEPADDDHYKSFEDLYGSTTTDVHRPGAKAAAKRTAAPTAAAASTSNIPTPSRVATGQTAKCVKRTIRCGECHKPRVLYSQTSLSHRQLTILDRALEGMDFVCGMLIEDFHDSGDLQTILNKVYVKPAECQSPIETGYYSSNIFPQICNMCGKDGQLNIDGKFPVHDACL